MLAAGFETQIEKPKSPVEAKLEKTIATGSEAKPEKTVLVVLRQNVIPGFYAKTEYSSYA
jgi:hypothetical protein